MDALSNFQPGHVLSYISDNEDTNSDMSVITNPNSSYPDMHEPSSEPASTMPLTEAYPPFGSSNVAIQRRAVPATASPPQLTNSKRPVQGSLLATTIPGRYRLLLEFERAIEEEEFEVERVLGRRRRGKTMQYLVRWRDYGSEADQWVPARDMRNAQEAIKKYEQSKGPTRRKVGRPRKLVK